jgi:hypothetical protein
MFLRMLESCHDLSLELQQSITLDTDLKELKVDF